MKTIGLFMLVTSSACLATSCSLAETGPSFSSLPITQQYKIRESVQPPPIAARYGPYSTPMYYMCRKGYTYAGGTIKNKLVTSVDYGSWTLDRNKPEWLKVILQDWAELGLNNTHVLLSPEGKKLTLSPAYRRAIEDYVRLSGELGLKVGVRLDPVKGSGYRYWEMNPDNPDNYIATYLPWVKEVAGILKGQTAYYVLGDEMKLQKAKPGLAPDIWTPEKYLGYFKQVSGAIKEVDPEAKVSMFAAVPTGWHNILYLLDIGYAKYGDGLAINYNKYNDVGKLFEKARKRAPDLLFLSNGVGYCATATAQPRFPLEDKNYPTYPSEETQAYAIAKNMFSWWDLKADTAPYYIVLRNWVIRGKVYPRWYGFFGFEDFVIDDYDNMTIKRYPAWYAFQTVTHTFYNRKEFKQPEFEVLSTQELSMFRAYEHERADGAELVMMLWNDSGEVSTTVSIATDQYKYPVKLSLFNYHEWSDVPHDISPEGMRMTLKVSQRPLIIRLVRTM